MMAAGMDVFRSHFRAYQDQYVLIGGMACDLLLNEAGERFRPTRDVDMVLIVEALTSEFAEAFWAFIEAGGYEARLRNSGKPEFYRFVNPKQPEYPVMIELFARPGNNVNLSATGHLTPLHIDDDISSLSAILLNEAYYRFLLNGKTSADGVSVLDAEHLVPMKMKAWLDLTEKSMQGIHVNERDLRKHRQDVFRLYPLIREDILIPTPEEVRNDVKKFVDTIRTMPFDPGKIGLNINKDHVLDVYSRLYVPEG
jgi:hypothetical protein